MKRSTLLWSLFAAVLGTAAILALLSLLPGPAFAGARADSLRTELREASAWSAAAADLELYQARRNPDLPYGGVAVDLAVDTDPGVLDPVRPGESLKQRSVALAVTSALGPRSTLVVGVERVFRMNAGPLPPCESRIGVRVRLYLGGAR